MTEFVMVPRELVQSAICYIDSKDEREGDFIAGPLERALDAAQVTAKPVAGVILDGWGQPALVGVGDEDAHVALRGARRLYTHPKEPVNQQLLEALRMATSFKEGGTEIARDAIAAAEAQTALPTQEAVMRLADEYATDCAEDASQGWQRVETMKARAALLAALAALPREKQP